MLQINKVLKFFLILIISIIAGIIVLFLSLFFVQNLLDAIQAVDLYLYQASNTPSLLLANLQQQSKQEFVYHEYGPKINKLIDNSATNLAAAPTTKPAVAPKLAVKSPSTNKTQISKTQTNKSSSKMSNNKKVLLYKIVIPKIGVDTAILRFGDITKRMYKGVAFVNGYGTPSAKIGDPNYGLPTILVSHRFGYIWWTPSYRRKNSFHNIDKLNAGDKIYIEWNGKWYLYKVRQKQISKHITNYNSDLILYSCVSYTSPYRIYIYATKISP